MHPIWLASAVVIIWLCSSIKQSQRLFRSFLIERPSLESPMRTKRTVNGNSSHRKSLQRAKESSQVSASPFSTHSRASSRKLLPSQISTMFLLRLVLTKKGWATVTLVRVPANNLFQKRRPSTWACQRSTGRNRESTLEKMKLLSKTANSVWILSFSTELASLPRTSQSFPWLTSRNSTSSRTAKKSRSSSLSKDSISGRAPKPTTWA